MTLSQTADSYTYGTTLTATATAYGNSRFVCWREEGVVVSTDAEYTFTVDHNVKLVAYFAPNTDKESYPTGITATANDNDIAIEVGAGYITAHSATDVTGITVYTVNAAAIATAQEATICTGTLNDGVYIVRVTTAGGYKNFKVFIKK